MTKENKVMMTSFITNIFLSIAKIIFGIIGSSGALIADGIHSFSDMITDTLAIVGNIISRKPADHEHPYGHGNAEYLTCLLIGVIVFAMGIKIILEAVTREAKIPNIYALLVTIMTIIIKLLLARYILKKGKKYNNEILISSGKESYSDVASSIIVLISLFISNLSNINSYLIYADKIAMIVVGALIIKISVEILKDNLSNLLGKRILDKKYTNKISNIILKNEKIKKIDSLIIIKFGYSKKIDCEVSMDKKMTLEKVHDEIDKIEKEIKTKDSTVNHIIIHVNPYID